MKVYIEKDPIFFPEVKYIFSVFARNKQINYELVEEQMHSDFSISSDEGADIRISGEFYKKIGQKKYDHTWHFSDRCLIVDPNGYFDYLSTAFYILSTLQEVDHPNEDMFGRFPFNESFQYKYHNVAENLVQKCFDDLCRVSEKLKGYKTAMGRTRVFLSHDIDTIHGALLQDGFYSIKKLRPDWLVKVFLINIFTKPHWLNIDRIMKIESEYDFHSTFYWLVNRGKVNDHLSNSDYNIHSKPIQACIQKINNGKWENGLHKSAKPETFEVEMNKIGAPVYGNRFHYLKYKPHVNFSEIDDANLLFDTSIGFAETYGFRSGYGQPYHPYDFTNRKPFNFIECPMNIMDTTFFNYLKVSSEEFVKRTIDFFESNNDQCILSVLFHNNFISDFKYRNYSKAFKTLLSYFYESNFTCITQREIIKQFRYEHKN